MITCQNCETEIPPTWVKVIEKNVCPNCEGQILNDNTITLIDELATALEQMPNDPRGLAGWLIANYRMQKVGSAEPVVKFNNGKVVQQKGGKHDIDLDNLKIAGQTPLDKFYKNAGMEPNKYRDLMEELKDPDAISTTLDPDELDEMEEAKDPEHTKRILDAMQTNSLKDTREQMRQYTKTHNVEVDFSKDDPKTQALIDERLNRLRKQAELDNGGIGKIKRS